MSHVPEPIKEKASRAFKATKDKIMGLHKSFKGEETEKPVASAGFQIIEQNEESFNPVKLEQAFDWVYRSYRINGRSRIDVDTFFDQSRQNLIDHISKDLTGLNSTRVQMATWIRLRMEHEDGMIDRVRLPLIAG